MDRFFSVNTQDAALSGLQRFTAEAVFRDINISPALVLHLSPTWHIGAGLFYRRLVSDAADSPLVDQRGSIDQLISGIGLAYSW